jgi:glycosyltransferase involved in cell wall biosynthesis
MKPIGIAHLIATNFYGGPEKQILTHALQLNKDRFHFVLISFIEKGQPNQLVDKARSNGVKVVEVPINNPFDPITISKIYGILRKYDIQILCAHGYKSNVIGRLASWLCGIPQISISRGWTAENRKIRFYEKLDKFFLKFTNHIVAVSHGQREKILALRISPSKVTVIHNAINLAEIPMTRERLLRKQLGLPENALIVASAGRLSPEKNYATMINVAKQVVSHNNSAYFVVFGEGFLRPELEAQIASSGLIGRFLLTGFRTDLQQVIQDIDIFMLPSFTEGLPNVVLEAFAANKPVVATRVGGTPEVVQDGISGFLTKPDETELMIQHVLMLLDDSLLRTKMGSAGYYFVQDKFGFEKQTKLYEELYVEIVK